MKPKIIRSGHTQCYIAVVQTVSISNGLPKPLKPRLQKDTFVGLAF